MIVCLFVCLFVCFYWAASFLVAVERNSQKKRSLVKFGVNNYNTSSYYPKPFRAISGLNHSSECCVFNMTIMEAVGSCTQWEFIWNTST